jgi:hypothetical protein
MLYVAGRPATELESSGLIFGSMSLDTGLSHPLSVELTEWDTTAEQWVLALWTAASVAAAYNEGIPSFTAAI